MEISCIGHMRRQLIARGVFIPKELLVGGTLVPNSHGQVIEINEDKYSLSFYARWLYHLRNAINDRGSDIHAANHIHSWVKRNCAFEVIAYHEHFLVSPPKNGSRC